MQRLERFLSQSGQYSRREWKEWIKAGRVACNGKVVRDGGIQVDPENDEISFDGQRLAGAKRVVIMLHKPAGYVTATEDRHERTVMELLPPPYDTMQLYPVGRLDKQTEGLLLFTNDGALLHRLIAPRCGVKKVYYAEHTGTAGLQDVQAFSKGLVLRDGTNCRPAGLEPLGEGKSYITVYEGKYHQVRRMMAARGMRVNYLRRVSEGNLKLGDLEVGKVRILTENEIFELDNRQVDE